MSHLRPTPATEVVGLSQLITRTVYNILTDRISYLYTNDIRMFVSWPGNMHLLRDTTPSRIFSSEASMKSNQMKLNPAMQHVLCDSEKIPLHLRKNLFKWSTSPVWPATSARNLGVLMNRDPSLHSLVARLTRS